MHLNSKNKYNRLPTLYDGGRSLSTAQTQNIASVIKTQNILKYDL